MLIGLLIGCGSNDDNGDSDDKISQFISALTDFGDALCMCVPASATQDCQTSIQQLTDELSCEIGVFEREELDSTVDCLIEEAKTAATCVETAACDQEALLLCVNISGLCPEIPDIVLTIAEAECGEPDFICGDGENIPAEFVCDNEDDCVDGSDEANCSEPNFICGDGGNVPADFVCDSDFDCADGSDEANCSLGILQSLTSP